MKNIILVLFLLSAIIMIGCSSFKRSKPDIKEKNLPESCEGITKLIKKKWKKHKELDYYHKDKEFLDKLVNDYEECLIGLSAEKVIQLFGNTPVKVLPLRKWGKHRCTYYLEPECLESYLYNCEMLVFRFENEVTMEIGVGEYELLDGG